MREAVASRVGPLGRKVAAVISYDACTIDPEICDAWFAMAADVESRFYTHVSRYTTSAFMRLKLGEALIRRDVAPAHLRDAAGGPGLHCPASGDGMMPSSENRQHRTDPGNRTP